MAKKWHVEVKDYSIILHTETNGKTPPFARLIGAIRHCNIDIYITGKLANRHQNVINVLVNKCQELHIPLNDVCFLWRNAPKQVKIEANQLKSWED